MTPAPTATRRRGQAAAGAQPPRRPRAARTRVRRTAAFSGTVTAALAVLAAACAALAGCAASSAAKPAATNATTSANVFTVSEQASLPKLNAEISDLYRSHPGVASFEVQGVQYSAASRATVLRECTSAGTSAGSQDAETSQLVACAPLIFFYYSYGKQDSVPAAVTVAGQLYWYAVTHVTGPESAKTSLDEVLQSWKLQVPGLTAAQQNTVVATSVINAADDSMLTQKGVHVVITDQAASSAGPVTSAAAERIVADIGTVTGTETITDGTTKAAIRITSKAAYFTGDPTGLTAYLGLSQKSADKVASRWVAIKAGTTEYQALAGENTIAEVPSSLLPSAADAVQVRTATISGRKTYVLTWKAAASGSSPAYSAQLILTATPQILPVSETIATSSASKTVTFSRWGSPFTVAAPASVIPYSEVSG